MAECAVRKFVPSCSSVTSVSFTRTSHVNLDIFNFFFTFILFLSANMFKICMLMFVCILYSSSELHMLAM